MLADDSAGNNGTVVQDAVTDDDGCGVYEESADDDVMFMDEVVSGERGETTMGGRGVPVKCDRGVDNDIARDSDGAFLGVTSMWCT